MRVCPNSGRKKGVGPAKKKLGGCVLILNIKLHYNYTQLKDEEISMVNLNNLFSRKWLHRITAFSIVFTTHLSISEELVNGEGLGIADTKIESCEIALNNARREASQSATTIVKAKFSSLETSSGVSYRSDVLETTVSYAKLTTKSESIDFDSESGLIKCTIKAVFRVGAIIQGGEVTPRPALKKPAKSNHRQMSKIQNLHISTSGEPFCIDILNGCFREHYNKENKQFGIQILKGKNRSLFDRYAFFNTASVVPRGVRERHGSKWVKIETKEELIKVSNVLAKKKLKRCNSCPAYLYITEYKWDRYNKKQKAKGSYGVLYGASNDDMDSFFYEGYSLSEDEIKGINLGSS